MRILAAVTAAHVMWAGSLGSGGSIAHPRFDNPPGPLADWLAALADSQADSADSGGLQNASPPADCVADLADLADCMADLADSGGLGLSAGFVGFHKAGGSNLVALYV